HGKISARERLVSLSTPWAACLGGPAVIGARSSRAAVVHVVNAALAAIGRRGGDRLHFRHSSGRLWCTKAIASVPDRPILHPEICEPLLASLLNKSRISHAADRSRRS